MKKAMLTPVPEEAQALFTLYGKTGTGLVQGSVADAWFTGFAEREAGNLYFCVYLRETEGREISGAAAKEIAVRVLSGYCENMP